MPSLSGPQPNDDSPPVHTLATVVDITARLNAAPSMATRAPDIESMTEDQRAEFAANHWASVLGAHGLSMEQPAPPGVVLEAVATELERLYTGALFCREGGGPRGLEPNPEAGMDLTSVLEAVSVLREMGRARGVLRRLRRR